MAPSATAAPAKRTLMLPMAVAGPVDLGRLIREIEAIDNALLQGGLHGQEAKMPKTSLLMDALIQENKLNLLQEGERTQVHQFLEEIKQKAPVLHMSFSSDPSPAVVEKLMAWLRREIHPYCLLTIGLQPTIGAGCLLRTTNRYFDFSLRERFRQSRELLMKNLEELYQ